MLKSVTARTKNPFTGAVARKIDFPYFTDSDYIIKNIAGTGPVKHTVTTMATPLDPGGTLMSTKAEERNLVFTFGFANQNVGGTSITNLRNKLNTVFTPGMEVELVFDTTQFGILLITGVVETNEPNQFVQEPEVVVSILCSDPYYRDTIGYRTINLGGPNREATFQVPYDGDVPVGYIVDCIYPQTETMFQWAHLPAPIFTGFELAYPFKEGSQVIISSEKGNRYVSVYEGGVQKNLMGSFRGSLIETRLRPGINYINFGERHTATDLRIRYRKLYGAF